MASDASAPPSRLKRGILTILKGLLYAAGIGLIAVIVAVVVAMNSLPNFDELSRRSDLGQTIRVHGADGSVLVAMGPSFGEWLSSDEIPQIMKDALISVEDKRFHSHIGVDPIGLVRAVGSSVITSRRVSATSTITQQLARNIFLSNNRSYGRKGREMILALALERKFSKNQILELYLNRVYFGGGAFGIDAASRKFFGHSARTLNLSEAAIIAGLVKAPSNYAPSADPEAGKARAATVIRLMQENGVITAAQAASAAPAQVKIVPTPRQNSVRYFTDWMLPQLDTLISVNNQPIEVWTTLDPNMQKLADQAINANTPAGAQGALVALDRDGAVRAMVGGKDYVNSIYNRATQANRQPGSSFKLFVYLAALEAGYKPDQMVSADPITINGWSPRNNGHVVSGMVTLRQAFAQSINTVSARLGQEVGFRTVADMAQRLGITSKIVTHPSMTLGSSEVRLLDMTRAYAAVGAKGVAVVPYGIKRVTTAKGELLYQQQPPDNRVLFTPWVAAEMTDLMQTAVLSGTGRAAQIGRPVAGKTGTTTLNKDGWFLGFSSGLTTGIWMGRDDNKVVPGLQGGTAPARAFHDFMIKAVANRPVENFDTQVKAPDWHEPDQEAWGQAIDNSQAQVPPVLVNPDGTGPAPAQQPVRPREEAAPPPRQDTDSRYQSMLDRATGRDAPQPPRRRPRPLPPPPDAMEPRTFAPQP
jgi:penicillin-binding protein 1A